MITEAKWTPVSEWCPNPEHWHAADWDSAETEVTELVAAFVRALQPDLVVETGTAWGQTAEAIGHALAANGHGRLVTFETDPERVIASRQRCTGLPVDVLEQESLSWTPDEPIGFAWFDSLLPLRLREFDRYLPAIAPGVVVGFHDTAPHHRIGDKIAAHPKLVTLNLRTPRGVIFGQVL
jgi:predicted O-methyltransferase YrrM